MTGQAGQPAEPPGRVRVENVDTCDSTGWVRVDPWGWRGGSNQIGSSNGLPLTLFKVVELGDEGLEERGYQGYCQQNHIFHFLAPVNAQNGGYPAVVPYVLFSYIQPVLTRRHFNVLQVRYNMEVC